MVRSALSINRKSKRFWQATEKRLEKLMSEDPFLLTEAVDDLRADFPRYFLYSIRPLEQVILEIERKKRLHHREFSQRGGRAPKPDRLQRLINHLVQRRPLITRGELEAELRMREKSYPITEIFQGEILLEDGKSIPLSGLKDRLSRAKKKLESR